MEQIELGNTDGGRVPKTKENLETQIFESSNIKMVPQTNRELGNRYYCCPKTMDHLKTGKIVPPKYTNSTMEY